jgi:hypothetical protein
MGFPVGPFFFWVAFWVAFDLNFGDFSPLSEQGKNPKRGCIRGGKN